MARNAHKIPKAQWNKWNKNEQAMFNRFWRYINHVLLPPGVILKPRQMNVLRHNVCFMAAECLKDWR